MSFINKSYLFIDTIVGNILFLADHIHVLILRPVFALFSAVTYGKVGFMFNKYRFSNSED